MSVGRNDPCPCSSGKKYKKCCLRKNNLVQITEYKREQFYQNKHALVEKMTEFMVEHVPFNEYHKLKSQFRKRLNSDMSQEGEEQYFNFWLHFFNRFENGLRGVEWFFKENEHRLQAEEKEMARSWITLQPKLLQAINRMNNTIIFEDIFTKEQFSVSDHEENLPYFYPWISTFALIESFQEHYYFNGVRSFVGPENIQRAKQKVNELMTLYNQGYEQILIDFYPEILGAVETKNEPRPKEQDINEVSEHTLTYQIENDVIVLEYLKHQPDLSIEKWTTNEKSLVWLGNWRAYQDSELKEDLKIADVYGNITITDNFLEFQSVDEEKTNQWKALMNNMKRDLTFVREEVNTLNFIGVQLQNTVVSMEKGTPRYYALYAQNALINELDQPIPLFNHLSVRQLVEKGRIEEAETWLKQLECNMYYSVVEQYGEPDTTADYNTVRKNLGLPLSPFVTGGKNRKTSYSAIDSENEQAKFTEDDIPYFQTLGFGPDKIDNFYTADIVRFYKERTIGKSETTVRKYSNSLYDLRELMERNAVTSWEQCDVRFWYNLIFKDYFELVGKTSKTERNNFLSTIKMFLEWLDKTKKTAYFVEALKLFEKMDEAEKYLKMNV